MPLFVKHDDWFRSLSRPGGDPERAARFMDSDHQRGLHQRSHARRRTQRQGTQLAVADADVLTAEPEGSNPRGIAMGLAPWDVSCGGAAAPCRVPTPCPPPPGALVRGT